MADCEKRFSFAFCAVHSESREQRDLSLIVYDGHSPFGFRCGFSPDETGCTGWSHLSTDFNLNSWGWSTIGRPHQSIPLTDCLPDDYSVYLSCPKVLRGFERVCGQCGRRSASTCEVLLLASRFSVRADLAVKREGLQIPTSRAAEIAVEIELMVGSCT